MVIVNFAARRRARQSCRLHRQFGDVFAGKQRRFDECTARRRMARAGAQNTPPHLPYLAADFLKRGNHGAGTAAIRPAMSSSRLSFLRRASRLKVMRWRSTSGAISRTSSGVT